MRKRVFRYIRERGLLRAGERVAVAVSGGADSVALLRLLLELREELGVVLAVAHFNHGLRGEASGADEAFVAGLARQHGLEFFAGRGDVRRYAGTARLSLEAAGRMLRYEWLAELAASEQMNAVATAHTLDDQAETVLLKLLRGAGTRGLAGIYPELRRRRGIRFVRPLLAVTRSEVEAYLAALGQSWREDESNRDRRFLRNRVRHELLPLLEREYNPNLRQVLSETAEVARGEEQYWQRLVEQEFESRSSRAKAAACSGGLKGVSKGGPLLQGGQHRLDLSGFVSLPLALRRRLLRRFAEGAGLALDFQHVEALVQCTQTGSCKAGLPDNWIAARRGNCLELRPPSAPGTGDGYEYVLPVPGEVQIAELDVTVRAVLVKPEFAAEAEPGSSLNAALLGPELTVRNWREGDRYWPAHRGSEEKLKRLFAERHIPAEERPSWPVVLKGEQIVWVKDFPVAKALVWQGQGEAAQIECTAPPAR